MQIIANNKIIVPHLFYYIITIKAFYKKIIILEQVTNLEGGYLITI